MYTAFTYLIGWKTHNKWYYGIRYKKGCNVKDIWTKYFTSSKIVHQFSAKYGPPDIIQIRRKFIDITKAKIWESKVLKRMNVAYNEKFLNCHTNIGPPILKGDINPCKRLDVRKRLSESSKRRDKLSEFQIEKMKHSKMVKGLILSLKKNYIFKPSNSKTLIKRLKKYIEIIDSRKRPCFRIKALLITRLDSCINYIKKPYPKKRKLPTFDEGVLKQRGQKIAKTKLGKKWYHNPITKETRPFSPNDVPDGWVLGMIKRTPNNNTQEVRKKISESMKVSRSLESLDKIQMRKFKYHETIQNRISKSN